MSTLAQVGMGAKLKMNVAPGTSTGTSLTSLTYTAVGEVVSLNPNWTVGEADVTHLGSGGFSDFLPTRFQGTLSGSVNWLTDPDGPGHVGVLGAVAAGALLSPLYNRTVCAFELCFPSNSDTASPDNMFFRGFFTEVSPDVGRDDGISAPFSIRMSDSVIATNAAEV